MRISDWSSDVCSPISSFLRILLYGDSDFTPADRFVQAIGFSGLCRNSRVTSSGGAYRRCGRRRSEEHTSELQSLMRISYAVFCLKKKKNKYTLTMYNHDLTHKTTKQTEINNLK